MFFTLAGRSTLIFTSILLQYYFPQILQSTPSPWLAAKPCLANTRQKRFTFDEDNYSTQSSEHQLLFFSKIRDTVAEIEYTTNSFRHFSKIYIKFCDSHYKLSYFM